MTPQELKKSKKIGPVKKSLANWGLNILATVRLRSLL